MMALFCYAHLCATVESHADSQANRCREYDMFGIAPNPDPSHPMYGLFKFKQGFGGNIFHQLGCRDYLIDNDKYSYFAACEMNMQGYYSSK